MATATGDDRVRARGHGPGPSVAASSRPSACSPAACSRPGNPGRRQITLDHRRQPRPARHLAARSTASTPTTAATLAATRTTVVRMGGNRWTAYNWENNASNAGSDYCFQNDNFLSSSNTPGAAVKPDDHPGQDRRRRRRSSPSRSSTTSRPTRTAACDVRNSGPNYLQTRFKQNRSTKPTALSLTPERHRRQRLPGRVRQLGEAGRAAAPTSCSRSTTSPTSGRRPTPRSTRARSPTPSWPTATSTTPRPSRASGRRPRSIGSGQLRLLRLREPPERPRRGGQGRLPRLVPRPDEGGRHRGRPAAGRRPRPALVPGGDRRRRAHHRHRHPAPRSWPPGSRRRARCGTRPTSRPAGSPSDVRLRRHPPDPRGRKDQIAAHYPGTGLAFTEWNYGGGDHISGAIAYADVLGIFGREGVDLATYWPLHERRELRLRPPSRAFRNYDGAGGHFGDTSVRATTSDVDQLDRLRRHRRGQPQPGGDRGHQQGDHGQDHGGQRDRRADLGTPRCTRSPARRRRRRPGPTLTSAAQNAFLYTMPAQSVTVIVPSRLRPRQAMLARRSRQSGQTGNFSGRGTGSTSCRTGR